MDFTFEDLNTEINMPGFDLTGDFYTDSWQFPPLGLPYVALNDGANISTEAQTRRSNRRQRGRIFTPSVSPHQHLVISPVQPRTGSGPILVQDTFGAEGRVLLDNDLLNYYRTTVTSVMMPTIDPLSNPWLQIYLPLASGEPCTPSKLALRHALMSVAAYQRACREKQSKQQDMRLGYHHEQEASRILKSVLQCHTPANQTVDDKSTTLAAALGLISVDIFGPRSTDCRIHLSFAKQIVDPETIDLGAQTRSLHEDESLSTTPEVLGQLDAENEFEASVTDAGCFILDSSFGISKKTLFLLRQTIHYGSMCSSQAASSSGEVTGALRVLYRSLYAIEDDPSDFLAPISPGFIVSGLDTGICSSFHPDGACLPKLISDELIENHQWAFHYAVIIYFHRVIPKQYLPDDEAIDSPDTNGLYNAMHGSISRKQGCQLLIRKVWDRLENIDCLTPHEVQLHRGNVLWPAFIAAVESVQVELRHRALIWFSKASKRGVGNIPRAKEVVMEVWRRVDRQTGQGSEPLDLGPVDWRVVMRETGQSIMLT
ncbi:hypothetical protein H9Q74_000035 [Fusarium xylarioides]|nr:hypothetical protein H9Q71_013716 [Fusarium xylarioides]KAG5829882.1 hypothetical protein H9Q74_000035 [Fusarium xylarioides]